MCSILAAGSGILLYETLGGGYETLGGGEGSPRRRRGRRGAFSF